MSAQDLLARLAFLEPYWATTPNVVVADPSFAALLEHHRARSLPPRARMLMDALLTRERVAALAPGGLPAALGAAFSNLEVLAHPREWKAQTPDATFLLDLAWVAAFEDAPPTQDPRTQAAALIGAITRMGLGSRRVAGWLSAPLPVASQVGAALVGGPFRQGAVFATYRPTMAAFVPLTRSDASKGETNVTFDTLWAEDPTFTACICVSHGADLGAHDRFSLVEGPSLPEAAQAVHAPKDGAQPLDTSRKLRLLEAEYQDACDRIAALERERDAHTSGDANDAGRIAAHESAREQALRW